MVKKFIICNLLFWGALTWYLDKRITDNYPSEHNIRQLAVHSFIRGCIMNTLDFNRCRHLSTEFESEIKRIQELKAYESPN